MENQTNYPQQQAPNSSSANTVLIIIVILILGVFGYWWYTNKGSEKAPSDDAGITIDVNLPTNENSEESGQ